MGRAHTSFRPATSGVIAFALALLGLAAAAPGVQAETFRLDPARTEIRFEVGAQGYPVTRGVFRQFTSNLAIDFEQPARSKVSFKVAAASLDTQIPVLDDYVRGPVFLDAGRYPEITFVSNSVEKLDDHRVRVSGVLTMMGVSKPETFLVDVTRQTGLASLQLAAVGRIHRSDYGMTGGLPLVSNDVGITVATLAAAQ